MTRYASTGDATELDHAGEDKAELRVEYARSGLDRGVAQGVRGSVSPGGRLCLW